MKLAVILFITLALCCCAKVKSLEEWEGVYGPLTPTTGSFVYMKDTAGNKHLFVHSPKGYQEIK